MGSKDKAKCAFGTRRAWDLVGTQNPKYILTPEVDSSLRVTVVRSTDNHSAQDISAIEVSGGGGFFKQALEDMESVLTDFSLAQNHPNTSNPITTISYLLPEASVVSLAIYDVAGREVFSWTTIPQRGYMRVVWEGGKADGQPISAGVPLSAPGARQAIFW